MIGSAAFNLLVTTGVSILTVWRIKKIEFYPSFLITFFFSCFAYVWMFVVLYIVSPAEVTLGEAVMTLLFYPIMVVAVWVVEVIT
jgi:solute carrier family 8 (sodium/calcium exchanger)